MKAVKAKLAETNPGQVEAFEKGAQGYAKKIVANFKDFEFVSYPHTTYPTFHLFCHDTVHRRVHEPRWHGCPP